ncbi:hypothetical protein [Peptostreptococcus porci]|uniref:hypothetical protein n=1 Tax=Peptostreptococcus porci TaxID=2652282 RepID=UPI002A825266|nr:hypothetical protein [Peptostreptococcus porci]MDY4129202.1 hypothetical protein [Peptostreptococcus porci]MDY5436523.1 hypothetical protein [Peptostreptococcus porci]MDY6231050.1 hypothetical protein [Peptostreptococcus porci]
MKVNFFNIYNIDNDKAVTESEVQKLFSLIEYNQTYEVSTSSSKPSNAILFSDISTDDYKLAFLSKKRFLNNSAFQSIVLDGETIDGVELEDFTIFVINTSGCCAVIQHSNSPRFLRLMKAFLQDTLGLKSLSVSSVVSIQDTMCQSLEFVDKITLSANSSDAFDPAIINKVSQATSIKSGSIKNASLSITLEENCKYSTVQNLFDNLRGYDKATIHGEDGSGEILIDMIAENITRFVDIRLSEQIEKEQLKIIFNELIKSYSKI